MPESATQARARRQRERDKGRRREPNPIRGQILWGDDEQVDAESLTIDKLVLDGMKRRVGKKLAKRRRGDKSKPRRAGQFGKVKYDEIKVRIENSITDAVVERTIEGASTVTLTIHDPDWILMESGLFDADENGRLDKVDIKLDKLWFRLVKVNPSGATLTLTFEDREVAELREYDKPRSVARKKRTRAQFAEMLVREVKRFRIKFFAPEKNVEQPIGKVPKKRNEPKSRQPGFHRSQRITVKGVTADAAQRRNLHDMLTEGVRQGVKEKLLIVSIMVVTQEAAARNSATNGVHRGMFQQNPRYWPATRNATRDSRAFFAKAKQIDRAHPTLSYVDLAERVQNSGQGHLYDKWRDEAERTFEQWGGSDVVTTTTTRTRIKQYRFRRGERGKREDSWTAMQRLAAEVNWRCFMRSGTVWFVSDKWLLKQRIVGTIHRKAEGVDTESFGFDWDEGKKVKTLTFNIKAKRWQFPPGAVINVTKSGPANGRWLVGKISKSLYRDTASITLTKPLKPKPEPAPETETVTSRGAASGDVRARIVQLAYNSMTRKSGFSRYSQAGALTADPTPPSPARTDCSQWVRAIYLKAGAGDPGTWTGAQIQRGRRTSHPKPGDLYISGGHVEMFIGDGKTIGHGSPPIDFATVAWCRSRGMYPITFDFLD